MEEPRKQKPVRIVFDIDCTLGKAFTYHGSEELFTKLQNSPVLRSRVQLLTLREDIRGLLYDEPIKFFFVFRKGAREIIDFCEQVWGGSLVYTAAKHGYGKEIIKAAYRGKKLPRLFYSFQECKPGKEQQVTKPLIDMLFEDTSVDMSRIGIVDDTRSTFEETNPDNAFHIKAWNPAADINCLELDDDRELFDLIELFKTIGPNDDIRTINKGQFARK